MPPDQHARERLGRQLAARRVELSPRYRNRRSFAADTTMNWRTLYDVELARRDNFRPETLRAFEAAYRLVPGSLDRYEGELEPLLPDAPRVAAVPALPASDPAAFERIAGLIARASPSELEMLDAVVGGMVAGNEMLEHFWRTPSRRRAGEKAPLEQRIRMIMLWLADDPRQALNDEGRHPGTGTGTA